MLGGSLLRDYFFRQFVFTIPEEIRETFKSKRMLSRLMTAVKKLINKQIWKYSDGSEYINGLAGKVFLETLHVFGEKGGYDFNPHINVLLVEQRENNLFLEKEYLIKMKRYWLQVLAGYGYRGKVVDINYRFRFKKEQMVHGLIYMQKPLGADDGALTMSEMIRDEQYELIKFYTEELSGIHQRRIVNKEKEVIMKEGDEQDRQEAFKDVEEILKEQGLLKEGQRPYFKYCGVISRSELFMKHSHLDGLVKVSDGVYIKINKGKRRKQKC